MSKYPKLNEFSKDQVNKQIEDGTIDQDFICDYISEIGVVYNKFIDEIDRLEKEKKDFKKWLIDYRFKKTGSHEDGRYCVAISVTDLLNKIDELESKNEHIKEN